MSGWYITQHVAEAAIPILPHTLLWKHKADQANGFIMSDIDFLEISTFKLEKKSFFLWNFGYVNKIVCEWSWHNKYPKPSFNLALSGWGGGSVLTAWIWQQAQIYYPELDVPVLLRLPMLWEALQYAPAPVSAAAAHQGPVILNQTSHTHTTMPKHSVLRSILPAYPE